MIGAGGLQIRKGSGSMSRAHIHKPTNPLDRASDIVTRFAGSWIFVCFSVAWFTVWIFSHIEPFPYGLLTLAVSLEAIFLNSFTLMSLNRQAAKDRKRDDLEASEVEQITRDSAILKSVNQEQLSILRQQEQLAIKLDEILAVLHKTPAPPKPEPRPIRPIKKVE